MNLPFEFHIEYGLSVEILAVFAPNNLTPEQVEARCALYYNRWWLSVMENTPEGYAAQAGGANQDQEPYIALCAATGKITACRTVRVRYWKAKAKPSDDTTLLKGKLILVRNSDDEEWKVKHLRWIDHVGAWSRSTLHGLYDSWVQYRFIDPSELANEENT